MDKHTVQELIALCKQQGIKGYSGKKKVDLIALLNPVSEPIVVDEEKKDNRIRVVSLFAGCGGLDYGFHANPAFTHVLVNDFDKDACATYEANYGIKPVCGDVKKLVDIPDCDLVIGGFPCQGFSMANPFRAPDDQRNELYLEILRILRLKQPKYFLLENVKGLLNMGGYATAADKKAGLGVVFKNIMEDLKECGYHVEHKLFSVRFYNVPQKRERVIICGIRSDRNVLATEFTLKWPLMAAQPQPLMTLRDAIGDLPLEYDETIQHIGTKHKCAVTGYLGNRELIWDDASPTITGRGGGSGGPVIHNHPSLQRRLTVRECARIQTFPDTFRFSGSISSMYKQIGNAVPCNFSVYLAQMFTS